MAKRTQILEITRPIKVSEYLSHDYPFTLLDLTTLRSFLKNHSKNKKRENMDVSSTKYHIQKRAINSNILM